MQIKSLFTRRFILGITSLVAVVTLALWLWYSPTMLPSLIEGEAESILAGKIFQQPQPLYPFQLVDHDGKAFNINRLHGYWSFLFFGYTHCPDVCPMTLVTYKEIHQQLLKRLNQVTDIQFIFISVDPQRDTPELLKQYVGYFHHDFIGVTGTLSALRDFTEPLGIFYRQVERPGEGTYWVEHSGSILLIDPQARLSALFPAPHHSRDLVAAYLQIREQFQVHLPKTARVE
ncbi:MAG: SCO family protein [Thioploca sp.]|nr:SCO family protein [Thioploca sp.]